MWNSLLTIALIFVACSDSFAQVGIGAGGSVSYPGLLESEKYNSRFAMGAGYQLFARHRLISVTDSLKFHARYTYQNFFSDIDLPFTQITRFVFNNLSITVFTEILRWNHWQLTGGGGIALMTITADKDFLSVTESLLAPQIQVGVQRMLGPDFNLFADVLMHFGSIAVRDDTIPITGFNFNIGLTMFIAK